MSKTKIHVGSISQETEEGKLLVAALAMMTTQHEMVVFGKRIRPRSMTPGEMLDYVEQLKDEIYAKENSESN